MRRNILPAILALVLVPSTVALVLRALAEPLPSVLPFAKPTYRVAVAVESAMQAELMGVKQGKSTCSQDFGELSWMDPTRVAAGTKKAPQSDKAHIPEDYAAFWMYLGNSKVPSLMVLDEMELTGKARDGRELKITIKGDPIGAGSVVDFEGDAEAAKVLGPKIAAVLAQPKHRHESPEDRAALKAFFNSTQFTVNTFMPVTIPAPGLIAPPGPAPGIPQRIGAIAPADGALPSSTEDRAVIDAGFSPKPGTGDDPKSTGPGPAKPDRDSDGLPPPGIDRQVESR